MEIQNAAHFVVESHVWLLNTFAQTQTVALYY